MSFRSTRWFLGMAVGGAMVGAIALGANSAVAQMTPDATLPNNSTVTVNGNTFNINGGTQAGRNLFHSFQQFSLPTENTASFNNAADIQNIFSRVTGESISNIDGLIRANGTANLFLINPNGIIFGPNASLNIGGSLLGSTASSLKFADGTEFNAKAPQTTPLLTISVPLGLQFRGNAGSILNQSQTRNSSGELVGLQVQPGKTLALVGGNVSFDGGSILAPGGRVELGGLAESETVGLFVDGNNLSLSYPARVQRADVSLTNGSVDVQAGGGGSIAINARNLDISGESKLQAGIREGLGAVSNFALDVTLNATDAIALSQSSVIQNQVNTNAIGNSGNINVQARSLSLNDSARIDVSTDGMGNAGNININVLDYVNLSGVSPTGFSSGLFSNTNETASGNGGSIRINTSALRLSNGAVLSASTRNAFDGGYIFVNANTLELNKAEVTVSDRARGNAGNLYLRVRDLLLLRQGSQISASADTAQVGGGGNGSQITANASNGFISSFTRTAGVNGDAGNISISAPNGFIVANGENNNITANAFNGRGGSINITALAIFGFRLSGQSEQNIILEASPTAIVDASSRLVFSSCAAFADSGGNSFTITGSGGLPPSPYEPLSNDVVWTDARSPALQQHTSNKPPIKPHSKPKAEPIVIVPATGWVFNGLGEVTLISSAPNTSGLGTTPSTCPGR